MPSLKIQRNFLLKNISSIKIGGRAKYFVEINSKKDLFETLKWAKQKNLPILIIGNASNILFSDGFFPGVVIRIKNSKNRKIIKKAKSVVVPSGMLISDFLNYCLKNQWRGYEWLAGIPGTIGGAVFGNAGAYGQEIGNYVVSVETIDISTKKVKKYSNRECHFAYRESIFKAKNEILWNVELKTIKGKKEQIEKEIKNYFQERIEKKNFLYPSLGCVFKNILVEELKNFEEIKKFNPPVRNGKISAGWLIEQCGLKGKKIGGAMIASFHANFIVNISNASSQDVKKLIALIKEKVFQKFKIQLKEEIIVFDY